MKNNKGITMGALVITIVVLVIIISITIGQGGKVIESSKLENLRTNMLLIQVKAKEYAEKANFNLGTSIENVSEDKIASAKECLKGQEITTGDELQNNINITTEQIAEDNANYIYYYILTQNDLDSMGLKNIEEIDGYIIKYDIQNSLVEIYSKMGYKIGDTTYYSLNEIRDIEL